MGRVFESRVVFSAVSAPWWLDGAAVDLDFQTPRYFDGADNADVTTLLSCSRASIGYAQTVAGTLTQFPANELRITDQGLLIEDARTNLILRSQEFDDGVQWGFSNCAVSSANVSAPDGTSTADEVQVSGASTPYLRQAFIGLANQLANVKYTTSLYVKAISGSTWLSLVHSAGSEWGSYFNLSGAGSVGSAVAVTDGVLDSASIEALANGWYRIVVTGHYTANHFGYVEVRIATADATWAGNVSDTYRFWGAQSEEVGTFASSYIPTTTAAATRARDVVAATGSLDTLFSSAAVSAVADIKTIHDTPVLGEAWVILGDNAGAEKALMNVDDSSDSAGQFLTGGASATIGGVLTSNDGIKVGGSWNASATSIVAQGGTVGNGAAFTAGIASMSLGGEIQARFRIYGYFRRLTAWNTRLADATLQGFTAP